MRIDQIVADVAEQLAGRLLRRALLALVIAALTVCALYNFTAAGRLALEAQYGALDAHLVVGAIYATLVLAGVIWWAVQGRTAKTTTPVVGQTRELQLVMLVEAVMLGYALANRRERAS